MTLDARDQSILRRRQAQWDEIAGPRVGDFCIMPDETLRRFTHDWGDGLQITVKDEGGCFYFGGTYVSYSGSLDPSLPKSALTDTGETREGRAWFFHHDRQRAHNGVDVKIRCRVYRYTPTK